MSGDRGQVSGGRGQVAGITRFGDCAMGDKFDIIRGMKCTYLILAMAPLAAFGQIINTKATGEKLDHYWSFGVGAGRVNEGLRYAWHEHLVRANKECGFKYVRMHDTFNDDMFVAVKQGNGKVVFNWQYVDEVYDRMLAEGVRPFVEFSFFPSCIAAENSRRP